MRKSLVLTTLLLALGTVFFAHAASPTLPVITTTDIENAGYTSVTIPAPENSRYEAPVQYFRVAESLSATDALKDCNDCGNLVAVYLAESSTIPDWIRGNADPLRLIGGRVQARRYHAPTKTVLIVTGPDTEKVIALSDLLLIRTAEGS